MYDGHSFGELALENDAPRSASVKAIVPTHLAVLEKEDYMVIKKTLVMFCKYCSKINKSKCILRNSLNCPYLQIGNS